MAALKQLSALGSQLSADSSRELKDLMADISMTVNGKVRKGNVEPRLLLVALPPRTSASDRHAHRVRHESVRRLHRPRRRPQREVLHDLRGPGRRLRRSRRSRASASNGQLHPLQEGFWEEHGLQCGYCTPGMIMAAVTLLQGQPDAVGAGDPRGHLRQLLPLHRLPAHRQRHSARRDKR